MGGVESCGSFGEDVEERAKVDRECVRDRTARWNFVPPPFNASL